MSFASFDVDCQKTFTPMCPNELPVPNGHLISEELNSQARFCTYRIGSKDAHHAEAIWVADEANPTLSPLDAAHAKHYWPEHAVVGTEGFELLDELPNPIDYDYFVWKGIELDLHPYGACYHDITERRSTGVIEFLKCNQVTTVVVGGLTLDFCVKTTAEQLRRAGFEVIVNLAATVPVAKASGDEAIESMRAIGIKTIDYAAQLTEGFS